MWRGIRAVMIVLGVIPCKLPEKFFAPYYIGLFTSDVDTTPGAHDGTKLNHTLTSGVNHGNLCL
tara:strand:- start:527 stop:718 length:192 start_codon:yes stop_codon:yes gene_type:complete